MIVLFIAVIIIPLAAAAMSNRRQALAHRGGVWVDLTTPRDPVRAWITQAFIETSPTSRDWKGPYRLGGCGDYIWVSQDERWALWRDGAWRLKRLLDGDVFTYDDYGELMQDLKSWG